MAALRPRRRWLPALGCIGIIAMVGAMLPTPDPGIADAVMQGADRETIVEMIRNGEDVNAAHRDGMTALHWVAASGDAILAEILLNAGARLETTTRLGNYTPLHVASMDGHDGVISLLLQAGASPHARTSSGGATPMHMAAGAGTTGGVRALLDHGAELNAREDSRGQTPLMFASARGRTEVVRLLLEQGADPSAMTEVTDVRKLEMADRRARQVRDSILATFRPESENGEVWIPTPGQVQAAARASRDVLRTPGGEDVDRDQPGEGSEDERAVIQPDDAASSQAESASESDEDSYDPGWTARVGTHGGMTALLYAARDGQLDVATALLEAGADVNQVRAGDETSPLLMASINGHFDLAMALLARGADPNLRNRSGDSPLYAAIETRWAPRVMMPQQHAWMAQETTHLDLARALLEAGADPNGRLTSHLWYMQFNRGDLQVDTRGATPFWRATHALDLEVMKLLVEYGADPGVPTMKPPERRRSYGGGEEDQDPSGLAPIPVGGPGVYPIHAASGVGHGQGFAANVHRHIPDGWLPAVRYLVEELGADVNARDYNGYTPVHHAASRGDNELIRFLVEHGADVTAISRRGQTTVDMANGPVERIQPMPRTIALLEELGAKNSHNCISC